MVARHWLLVATALLLVVTTGCTHQVKGEDLKTQLSILTATALLHRTPDGNDNECPRCDGRGRYPIADTGKWQDPCDVCDGTGKASRSLDQDQEARIEAARSLDQDQAARSLDQDQEARTRASIQWIPLAVARQNGKPTWIHFVSEGCPPCKLLQEGPFHDPKIIKMTQNINCVRINVPSDNSIIWGVRVTPTDVWVNKDWRIIGRSNKTDAVRYGQYINKWKGKLNVK